MIGKGTIKIHQSLSFPIVSSFDIFFVLMGHFFENVADNKYICKKNVIIGTILSILSILLCCFMTLYKTNYTGIPNHQSFHNTLILIPSFTLFISSKLFFEKHNNQTKVNNIICSIGNCTFGIFLLEELLRNLTVIIFKILNPYIKTMPSTFCWVTSAVILGYVIVYLLKKIPILKKFI